MALSRTTLATKRCLVHGASARRTSWWGRRGRCRTQNAWYGEPAFDVAFCLKHRLKCLWTPRAIAAFLQAFEALLTAYLSQVTWEPVAELDRRIARLLLVLFLARADGSRRSRSPTAGARRCALPPSR